MAGIEEVKAKVSEVVDFLRDPDRYRRLGARAPKGDNRERLDAIVDALMEHETLDEADAYAAAGISRPL